MQQGSQLADKMSRTRVIKVSISIYYCNAKLQFKTLESIELVDDMVLLVLFHQKVSSQSFVYAMEARIVYVLWSVLLSEHNHENSSLRNPAKLKATFQTKLELLTLIIHKEHGAKNRSLQFL